MTFISTPRPDDLPGRPPIVGHSTWQRAVDDLLVREKAHTRAGDRLAAERRRLPMVEFDGTAEVVGASGPVRFIDLFGGRDELAVYKHMWHDGAPHQGQCEGCTVTAWHLQNAAPYLAARGVSPAIFTVGAWGEVEPYTGFMDYRIPWFSVRGLDEPIGGDMGFYTVYLRDGDRTFLTYRTTGRGLEPLAGAFGALDRTPYGRGETWEDTPDDRPEGNHACWYWRVDVDGEATWGPTGRPTPQWTRPDATPETTLGRDGSDAG
ncbi:DUF899 family protein [Gordonia sp. NB41Y]|uniref:DUF899 family protein n=1 Tax=Gordonia sp. NB41Y TaxID=875808 RepID=UPI0006B1C29F|nr:DUF899 family protein [Gordonia sp. NB41Y]KOY49696.1 hypothetical protein ISGA_08530 [Gordonia sp. NB41Y]WLP92689.1 DUF899 family protein [Gordonia sp. NB41Y]